MRRLSLQERLVVLVIAAILPVSALSVWFALREMRAATLQAQSQLKLAASLAASHQERLVDSAEQLMTTLAHLPGLHRLDSEACDAYFEALRARYPAYSNIGLFDLTGQVRCHAARGGAPFSAGGPLFQQALRDGRFAMGAARHSHDGSPVIPFARPVVEDGQQQAVVFGALDLARASAALARAELAQGANLMVLDRQGRVLVQLPPRPGAEPGRVLPPALPWSGGRENGAGEWVPPGAAPQLYAFASTHPVAGQAFTAVVSMDRAAVTHPLASSLREQLLALAATLLAGMALAWWLGGRFIVKPTKRIVGAVRRFEQGRLDMRVPLDGVEGQRDEFGRIAAAFNLMAESLQLRQQDLETELGHSRSAYAVLDTVLNSLQEGLIAANKLGQFLMFNKAANGLFALETARVLPEQWPQHFGMYHADGRTLFDAYDLPLARAIRGETGTCLMLVRRDAAADGRMLQCSFQPMHGEGGISGGLMVFSDVTEARRVEAELMLLRHPLARLNDMVLITEAHPLEAPGPRIVFVNETFERLMGYTQQEALGNTPRMLQGPGTDRAALDRIGQALRESRPVREELLNYTQAGREVWLELDIVPLTDEQGTPTHWISVQRDITGRRQAELALKSSEHALQDYSAMLQRSAEAAKLINQQHTLEDTLRVLAAQARQVIGAEFAHAVLDGPAGTPAIEAPERGRLCVPLLSRDGQAVGRLLLAGKHGGGDFTQRERDVAREMAQLAAVAIQNVRLLIEVRELNASLESRIEQRTAELAQQEARYRILAEQAPEIIWNVDRVGNVTFLNRAWYDLVGGEPAQWLGTGWLERIHPEDVAEVQANWARSRESLAPYMGTRRLRARDGSWHATAYRAAPVLGADGGVLSWVGIDTDITGLKVIEQALRNSNRELEAFSYSVSHDLRAPLAAIGGFSRALGTKLEGQLDDRSRHYLARIQAAVEKMEQLIDALLSLAKVVRAQVSYEPVDLSAQAREALESLQMTAPERPLDTVVQDGLSAQGDARLLRAVLDNLLGNAWKFTAQQPATRIEVGQLEGGGAFYVRDNGVGFDMAYADKLFAPFQRLHAENEFPGTGIGLATVQRIVARHQGRVWAESQPGRGATFFFTLGEAAAD